MAAARRDWANTFARSGIASMGPEQPNPSGL
jgi:hypothetical protein